MATRRKLPSGKYQFIVRITGHKPISKAFHTIVSGNKWAKSVEDALRSGAYYQTTNSSILIPDLLTQYLDTIKDKPIYKADRYTAKLMEKHFKYYTVATLPASAIREYIQSVITAGKATSTARRHIGLLSRALTFAQKDLDIQFKNPMSHIRLPSNKQKTTRRAITRAGQELILKQMTPEMQDITVLAIETAMRRGEILNIKPEHINHQKHTLLIPVTKTNTPKQYHCQAKHTQS